MKLSIGIKALNEEADIAAAIESALAAAAPFAGEVVLADSGSTDRTIEIARSYPVRIVQLANIGERCCGAGAQLAWQAAQGEYFYLLDGDMTLADGFMAEAVAYLDAHTNVAGVGGMVIEQNVRGQDFRIRAQKAREFSGYVDRLDCGGLYRMSAICEIGYFADRNLHAFEEFDLGARLAASGWVLARIGRPGVFHNGHASGGYRLLWRRLRTGYSGGAGEVVRAALGKPHLGIVLRRLRQLHVGLVVVAWWLALLGCMLGAKFAALIALLLLPLLLLALRRRSVSLALYSLAAWNVATVGLIGGLFRRRKDPSIPVSAVSIPK